MGNALKPAKAFNPAGSGTSVYAARYDDPRITAGNVTPQTAPAALGATTNLTAITAHTASTAVTAHTATTAVPGSFADEAAVQTYFTTFRTDAEAVFTALDATITDLRGDVETALDANDTRDTTLRSDAEARLDAIEAKVDAIIASLTTAGVFE